MTDRPLTPATVSSPDPLATLLDEQDKVLAPMLGWEAAVALSDRLRGVTLTHLQPDAGLEVAALALYDAVRLMRTFVGHDHIEPYPCPVFLVDEAQRGMAAVVDPDRERRYPPDLQPVYDAHMEAHAARIGGPALRSTPAAPKEDDRE